MRRIFYDLGFTRVLFNSSRLHHPILVNWERSIQIATRWSHSPLEYREDQLTCFGFTETRRPRRFFLCTPTTIKTFEEKVPAGYYRAPVAQEGLRPRRAVANKIMSADRTRQFEDGWRTTERAFIYYHFIFITIFDFSSKIRRDRPHPKMDERRVVWINAIFIDDLCIPEADRIGEKERVVPTS